jgi:5-methylcytosine-specific restriction endonuclease McrA
VRRRDGYRCTWRDDYGQRCDGDADEVDHIVPGDDHGDSNLRSLCTYHHAKKSAHEGGAANAKRRAKITKKFRRNETHPGLRR